MHPDRDVDGPPRSSRWFLGLLAAVAAVLLLIYLLRKPEPPVGLNYPGVGGRLPSLAVEPLLNADDPLTLDDLAGQTTLINFWGPWCPPCLQEMPELLALEAKHRQRSDVRFLLIAYPASNRDDDIEDLQGDVQAVLKRLQSDAPIYYDSQLALPQTVVHAAKLASFGFPTSILLDGEGVIRGVWSGYDPRFVEQIGAAIDQLASEKR